MLRFIEFPESGLRDSFCEAVQCAKCSDGQWLMESKVYKLGSDRVRYDSEDVREVGKFGELVLMYKGEEQICDYEFGCRFPLPPDGI